MVIQVYALTSNAGEAEMGIPDQLTCLLRNMYVFSKQQLELDMEQLEHVRTWHGTTDWLQI